jgi:D-alanyl-D-alanine carboxypeptidase (penicillin-binding protein 5/6)
MRRLAARLVIVGIALAVGGTAAGCSAAPGLAYAQDAARPANSSPAAVTAMVPASARAKTSAGPFLAVVGAPKGVKAKEGILVDATTGQVLWSEGENTPRPIASIAKVMTALVVLQAGGLNREITVPGAVTAYVAKYDANAAGLVPGQEFTVDELLHTMLIVSAADAAYTLANAYGPGLPAFIAKMNAEAAKLGLTSTHFTSPDGLPYPTETSTYSSPADLVRLGEAAMSYPEFRSIVDLRYYNLPEGDGHSALSITTSDALIGTYPGAIGIKDGFTDAAGHTLLFEAVRNGRTLIGDVLGSPPSGPASGAQDAAKILNWGFSLKQSALPASVEHRREGLQAPGRRPQLSPARERLAAPGYLGLA